MANDMPGKCNEHKNAKFDRVGNCLDCVEKGKAAIEKFRNMKQKDRRAF